MYGYDYLVWNEAREEANRIQGALGLLEPDVAREVRGRGSGSS